MEFRQSSRFTAAVIVTSLFFGTLDCFGDRLGMASTAVDDVDDMADTILECR